MQMVVCSNEPTLSISSHQHAESSEAEQSVSRLSLLPPLSPNIASLHNLWKWQRVGGEEKKKKRRRRRRRRGGADRCVFIFDVVQMMAGGGVRLLPLRRRRGSSLLMCDADVQAESLLVLNMHDT